jgi:hypothetical protein
MAAWLAGPLAGIANGVARERTYGRRLPERTAHQLSTLTLIGMLAAGFAALERRWPLPTRRAAAEVGAGWALLTVLFELGFGRAVAHEPWQELVADYDLRRGRLWAFVPAWLVAGPLLVRERRLARSAA